MDPKRKSDLQHIWNKRMKMETKPGYWEWLRESNEKLNTLYDAEQPYSREIDLAVPLDKIYE